MPDTLAQFIRKAGIDTAVLPADSNPNMPDNGAGYMTQHFLVTFKLEERTFSVPFSGGELAFATRPSGQPSAEDVLECLRSDAYSADQSFEDWCGDYGEDSDSRRAYATWQAAQKQTDDLRAFLGGANFAALLETEGY
jgi:hypothetical protein